MISTDTISKSPSFGQQQYVLITGLHPVVLDYLPNKHEESLVTGYIKMTYLFTAGGSVECFGVYVEQ
jgi:hypothetical protein